MQFPTLSLPSWLRPSWTMVAGLVTALLITGLLYRQSLTAAAAAQAECERDDVIAVNTTNTIVDETRVNALSDQVTQLQSQLADANKVGAEALERQRTAETRLRKFRAEQEAQKHDDETYAAWASTPLPDGVAERLRAASGSAADPGGDSPVRDPAGAGRAD